MEIIQLVDELRKRLWRQAPLLYIPGRSVRKVYKKNGTAQLEWIRHVDVYTRDHVVTVIVHSDPLFKKYGERLSSVLEEVLTEWNYEGCILVFSRSGEQMYAKGSRAQAWVRIVKKHKELFWGHTGNTAIRGIDYPHVRAPRGGLGMVTPWKEGVQLELKTGFTQTFSSYRGFDQWLTRLEEEEEEMERWKGLFCQKMRGRWGDVFTAAVYNSPPYFGPIHTIGMIGTRNVYEPYVRRGHNKDGFVYTSSVFGKDVSCESWETFQVQIEQEWNEALRIRSLRSLLT